MYILCDTQEKAFKACTALNHTPILMACKGCPLSRSGGGPSLVQMSLSRADQIFIFDLITLPQNARRQILRIISDKRVMKILWDGRMAYATLFYGHGTRTENALDLQLVDIHSREKQNIGRLNCLTYGGSFPMAILEKLQLEGLHALNSLEHALIEHSTPRVTRRGGKLDFILNI